MRIDFYREKTFLELFALAELFGKLCSLSCPREKKHLKREKNEENCPSCTSGSKKGKLTFLFILPLSGSTVWRFFQAVRERYQMLVVGRKIFLRKKLPQINQQKRRMLSIEPFSAERGSFSKHFASQQLKLAG